MANRNQPTYKKPNSTALEAAEAIGAMVSRGTRSVGKKLGKAKNAKSAQAPQSKQFNKVGKKPTAKDVKAALKGGHIKPAEAADLNPLGGLTPKSKDVKAALGAGHITMDEAKSLNPRAVKLK